MRISVFLSAALLAVATCVAQASLINYGPVSIGSDAPLSYDQSYSNNANTGLIIFDVAGIRSGGGAGYDQSSSINSFAFDVTPGYAISSVSVLDNGFDNIPIDYARYNPYDLPFSSNYRVAFSACSVADVCSSGEFNRSGGTSTPTPLNPLPSVGAGTGILEVDAYTLNTETSTYDFGVVRIGYTKIDPVPEPSSIALLGTGLLGIVGAIRRKLAS